MYSVFACRDTSTVNIMGEGLIKGHREPCFSGPQPELLVRARASMGCLRHGRQWTPSKRRPLMRPSELSFQAARGICFFCLIR